MADGNSGAVSGETLAKLFDCDERTIRNLAGKGIIVRQGRGQYGLAPSIRGYVRHLREQAGGRLGREGAADPVQENALLRRAQREQTELKTAILQGTVIKVEEIAIGWGRVVRAVRSAVLAAPAKIRFELPHLDAHDAEVIDRHLRQALEDAALGDTPPSLDEADDADDGSGPIREGASGEAGPHDPDGDEPA